MPVHSGSSAKISSQKSCHPDIAKCESTKLAYSFWQYVGILTERTVIVHKTVFLVRQLYTFLPGHLKFLVMFVLGYTI